MQIHMGMAELSNNAMRKKVLFNTITLTNILCPCVHKTETSILHELPRISFGHFHSDIKKRAKAHSNQKTHLLEPTRRVFVWEFKLMVSTAKDLGEGSSIRDHVP